MGLPEAPHWVASVEFVPFRNEEAVRPWRGWLASLEGPVHSFYLFHATENQHEGSNPTATVAAGATSATLSTAIGLTSGHCLTFSLASGKKQMVILTEDMSGNAVPSFRPPLREASTGTVESILPYAEMALSDDLVSWINQAGGLRALPGLDIEEAY